MTVKKKGKLSAMRDRPAAGKETAPQADAPGFSVTESISHIWLAGLGALAKAQKEGPRLFDALVTEGERMQRGGGQVGSEAMRRGMEEVREAVSAGAEATRRQADEAWENLESIFQDRVDTALDGLGVPRAAALEALAAQVDALSQRVKALEKGAEKTEKGKPGPRKKAVSRPASRPAKKS